MAADDEFRVEARLGSATGRPLAPTAESIQALQDRRDLMERINRKDPEVPFSKVLGRTGPTSDPVPPSRSAAARAALPKEAPRPGQRRPEEYGVKRKTRVVIKA